MELEISLSCNRVAVMGCGCKVLRILEITSFNLVLLCRIIDSALERDVAVTLVTLR